MHGGGRCAARLDLGAHDAEVFRADRGHPGFFQPAFGERVEALGIGRPEVLALLSLGGDQPSSIALRATVQRSLAVRSEIPPLAPCGRS